MTALEVLRSGALTTVQDLGRPGWAHLGVPRSGALDRPALRLGNAIVGNSADAAGLETTLTGCTVRVVSGPAVLAVTGAPARIRVGDRDAEPATALAVRSGEVVTVGPAAAGVRSYLAASGGIAVEPVLGSRSTDTLSGLGPAPLTDGMQLPLGPPLGVPDEATGEVGRPVTGEAPVVRIRRGPRDDWLTDAAMAALGDVSWQVSTASNRIGARLDGPALHRSTDAELPSEGLVLGAVQVPADGRPIVFLADHPTTGGYPVVAVVDDEDLPLLAQARPGTGLRMRVVDT